MVFITGGTGFLGAYIIKNLVTRGIAVRALRRSAALPSYISPEVFNQVEWVTGDVLDVVALQEVMEGVDAVIHSAAVVSFHAADRQQLYQTNVEGTTNVVNAAIDCGVKRFVHISSVAALGRSASGEIITENRVWEDNQVNTHYGITKHLAEVEVWRGFAEGLEGVMLNPSTILGFGDWNQSSCAIFKNTYNGFPWCTAGVNGFVGVEDVAEAAVQLLQSTLHQKRFIANADNWSFQQLLQTIADGFGIAWPHRNATPFLGSLAWRAERLKALLTGKKPLLSRETSRIAQSKSYFDNSALLQALPQFSYSPLEQVISEACARYLQVIQEKKA